jgi:hypothetical protein
MPCKGNFNERGGKMNIYNYFDVLALFVWVFLFFDAYYEIRKGRKNFNVELRLLIGAGGFIIDSSLVLLSILRP